MGQRARRDDINGNFTPAQADEALNIQEACRRYGINQKRVYRWIRLGLLSALPMRPGQARDYYSAARIEQLLRVSAPGPGGPGGRRVSVVGEQLEMLPLAELEADLVGAHPNAPAALFALKTAAEMLDLKLYVGLSAADKLRCLPLAA